MKSFTKLVFCISLLCLISCSGNAEYAYNQKMASLYFSVSDQFEEAHQELLDGKYKTKYEDSTSSTSQFSIREIEKSIKYLRENITSTQEDAALLSPSDKAKNFHAKANEFFDTVKGEYVDNLQVLADINCDCPAQRDSLITILKTSYSKISTIEDQLLETQKTYMESVGMQGVERGTN